MLLAGVQVEFESTLGGMVEAMTEIQGRADSMMEEIRQRQVGRMMMMMMVMRRRRRARRKTRRRKRKKEEEVEKEEEKEG